MQYFSKVCYSFAHNIIKLINALSLLWNINNLRRFIWKIFYCIYLCFFTFISFIMFRHQCNFKWILLWIYSR